MQREEARAVAELREIGARGSKGQIHVFCVVGPARRDGTEGCLR